ncbi:MAG TPA: hypothetical protein DDW90_02050 [Cyanobacteria bacterium UBA9971]|nr:hypothetical protein [Cyanobacteria bacterium UBA9971]
MLNHLTLIIKWCNENSGFLSLIIFAITLLLAWLTGVFEALKKQPKFKIELLNIPTFCCTFPTGNKYNAHDAHQTAISLYLNITNIGNAASSIKSIEVGYHNYTFKYTYLWFWLKETCILSDFCVDIGENTKVYPLLTQKSCLLGDSANTFLNIGQQCSGIVYFEQPEGWGGFKPRIVNNKVMIKVKIKDVFEKYHQKIFTIPVVSLEEARKYNQSFGMTYKALNDTEKKEKEIVT